VLPVASASNPFNLRGALPKETQIPLNKYLTNIKSSHSFSSHKLLFVVSFLLHRLLAQMPHLKACYVSFMSVCWCQRLILLRILN